MILSIDESIQRLKAEIIAQDWGLSTKRIDLLEAAFACLRERFSNRKAAHAILIMAGSVLDYVKRKGENTPSNSIDFLKEAMAHIVNLYEADVFDPESEKKLFNGLYFRFIGLKKKIKEERDKKAGRGDIPVGDAVGKDIPPDSPEEIEGLFLSDDSVEQIFIPETIDRIKERIVSLHTHTDTETDLAEVDLLINDLQMSLARAENVGSTIKQLVTNLNAVREGLLSHGGGEGQKQQKAAVVSGDEVVEEQTAGLHVKVTEDPLKRKCPPLELRELIFDDISLYIEESAISLIRKVSGGKQKNYILQSSVPLKDFSGLFRGLAKQFKGHLHTIPDKKLKRLTLPVMVPRGVGLPEIPDADALTLVCVTSGQWNGALLCSSVSDVTTSMVQFQEARNGDILGNGFCDEGRKFPLLDIVSLLRREGFLTMVESG
ncbi:MAG: hypothetical protein H8E41_02690 [Desulfobulbaceae bacterium]|uniref:Uncharacterized protein n=1 Tax=Candidatus Desulfobia pelagia TaxID=2841692 RepID=A0A8J6NDN0_9BACT|nr:hypothetical protein [Candidatus Desulfobia pelagia]